MLTIRKPQLEVLSDDMRKRFLQDTQKYLRETYPEQTGTKTDDQIMEFIYEGIDTASGYNIDVRADIVSFLEYQVLFGKGFEKDPGNGWARRVFRITNLPGDEKIERLKKNKPLTPEIE